MSVNDGILNKDHGIGLIDYNRLRSIGHLVVRKIIPGTNASDYQNNEEKERFHKDLDLFVITDSKEVAGKDGSFVP